MFTFKLDNGSSKEATSSTSFSHWMLRWMKMARSRQDDIYEQSTTISVSDCPSLVKYGRGEEPRKPKSFWYLLEQCSVWAMNKWINHNELLQRCQWPPPLGTIHFSLELTWVFAQKNGWAGLYCRALACEASEEGTQSYIKNGVCDISIIFFGDSIKCGQILTC